MLSALGAWVPADMFATKDRLMSRTKKKAEQTPLAIDELLGLASAPGRADPGLLRRWPVGVLRAAAPTRAVARDGRRTYA